MSAKANLEAMSDDELHIEQRRIVYMLQNDEDYIQDVDGRRWCYERLNQIGAILIARQEMAAHDGDGELPSDSAP